MIIKLSSPHFRDLKSSVTIKKSDNIFSIILTSDSWLVARYQLHGSARDNNSFSSTLIFDRAGVGIF
jgi:hypothetical protein